MIVLYFLYLRNVQWSTTVPGTLQVLEASDGRGYKNQPRTTAASRQGFTKWESKQMDLQFNFT